MAGETGTTAIRRLVKESRYRLYEIKDMLVDFEHDTSLGTLSRAKKHGVCGPGLEVALVKLHNRKFSKGKLTIPKEPA